MWDELTDEWKPIVKAVGSEIAYGAKKWRNATVQDHNRPVESWLHWAIIELNIAAELLYQNPANKAGRDHIRKATGHLFRAMFYHGVDARE